MLNAPNQASHCGKNYHGEKKGKSRDLAAEKVGFKSGVGAERALKALHAADAAEATGDAEQVEKAKLVKRELAKSLGGAVRVAREQGLIAAPVKKSNRTPAVAQNPGALKAGDIPEPASTQQAEQAAAQDQQQGSANIKGREPLPEHLRQTVKKEQKRIKDRWLPIAQHLTAAHDLIRAEKERLGREYAGPYGSLIMQKRWQLMADELEASGIFAQFADATRRPDVTTLESLLLELERSSRMANGWITSLLFYTGCRPDPTRYKGGEQAGQ